MGTTISTEFATRIAENWINAWNSHDIGRILAFYAEDTVFESPLAVEYADTKTCVIKGKDSLRSYWSTCLELFPNLYFAPPEHTITGENSICLIYQGVHDLMAVETMFFNEQGLISHSQCSYREISGPIFGEYNLRG